MVGDYDSKNGITLEELIQNANAALGLL